MKLETGSPTLNNGEIELTPQQQRANEITQDTANVGVIEQKLNVTIEKNDVFAKYPAEIQATLKDALVQECYVKYGEHPDIRSIGEGINPTTKENYIQVQVGEFLYASIHPDKVIAEYAQQNPDFDIEGLRTNLAEHAQKVETERTFNIEKDALQSAFQTANSERFTAVLERNREIEKAGFVDKVLGRVPDPIPNVGEQPLSREEILKHVDPKIAESETFQKMLDAMVTRLESYKTDIPDESLWGVVADTIKGVDAFVEVAVAESLNTGTKIAMNIGAMPIAIYHGVKEGSFDAGATAFIEIRNVATENYKISIRESSKEILGNNSVLQAIGTEFDYRAERFYDSVNFFWGEEAEFIARGATEAYFDISAVVGAGAFLKPKSIMTSRSMNSSNVGMGVEKASQELIDNVAKKRTVLIAEKGSEEMRYLDMIGAEANVGGKDMTHIILRENPSKAAVLEEFLHGTQQRLGIIDRLGHVGLGSAETHVKDFMIRHHGMLGISPDDVSILIDLKKAGL